MELEPTEAQRKARKKQTGLTRTHPAEYNTYQRMKSRCYTPTNKDFKYYGARGIDVCERWRHSFESFLQDMGPRPGGMSLDRIDCEKGYAPENCRWATDQQQAANRRYCHRVSVDGVEMTIQEAGRAMGMSPMTLRNRILKQGLQIEDAAHVGRRPYRRDSKWFSHDGVTLSGPEWAKKLGLSCHAFNERVRRGISPERLFAPKFGGWHV